MRSPLSLITKLSLTLSFLSLSACPLFQKDPIVLKINSQKWSVREFSKLLAQKIQALNLKDIQDEDSLEKIKEQLIGDLLMQNLIQKWAKEHAIFISEEELKQALKKIKSSYPSDKVFALYLKRKKINPEEWKKTIKNRLLREKAIQKISDPAKKFAEKELKEYYKNNLSLFQKNSRLLVHHLFHKQKEPLLKIKYLAKSPTKPLVKPRDDFIALAKKLLNGSQITQAQWIEKGTLEVFDKAFTLKKGEISPLWASPYGWHIIQVLDKKPAEVSPFLRVKAQIKEALLTQRRKALFAKWLDKESQKATILKNPSLLKNIKVKWR